MNGSSCFRRCHCRCICKRNLIISCCGSSEFCCSSISCITAIQFIACFVIFSRISFRNCICPSCWQTTNVYEFIFCQVKRSLIICKGEILYFIISSFSYENLTIRLKSNTLVEKAERISHGTISRFRYISDCFFLSFYTFNFEQFI